jgi:uncharacterized protein (DUF1015 family)
MDAGRMTEMWVDIAELAQSPIARNRAHLDGDRVTHYLTHLDDAVPVVVFDTGDQLLLADGYHRVEAAQQLGRTRVRADVRKGTRSDALAFAVNLGRQQRGMPEDDVLRAIKRRGDAAGP